MDKEMKLIVENWRKLLSESPGRRRNKFGDLEGSNEERWNKQAGRYDVEYSERQWAEAKRLGLPPWAIPDDEHHEWQKGERARTAREQAEYAEWLKTPEGQRSQMTGTEAEEWDAAEDSARRERRGKPLDLSKLRAREAEPRRNAAPGRPVVGEPRDGWANRQLLHAQQADWDVPANVAESIRKLQKVLQYLETRSGHRPTT